MRKTFVVIIWFVLSAMSACGIHFIPVSVSHSASPFDALEHPGSFLGTVSVIWLLWLLVTFCVFHFVTGSKARAALFTGIAIPVMPFATLAAAFLGVTF